MKIQVRSEDTLEYYGQLFAVPLVLIIDANLDSNPEQLQVGQTIYIPGYKTSTYSIRHGETIADLTNFYQLEKDALLLLNQTTDFDNLSTGEDILIPSRITHNIVNPKAHYDYSQLQLDLKALVDYYPFIQKRQVGDSVLKKSLDELQIGMGERKVQINASFHANEWITTCIFMQFLNDYLRALVDRDKISGVQALTLYEQSQLFAIPMVNPDGVDLVLNGPPIDLHQHLISLNKGNMDFSGWKANIRGVDLNKQFPANWEFEKKRKPSKPGPRDFLGYTPISEPETKAMAQLALQDDYDRLLSLHTQGKEIYWGYEGLEPPESAILAQDFAVASGYKAVQYVDSFVGYKDWFIQEFRKPGFTIELGIGQNPLPISQFDEIYADMQPLLVRALR